MTLAFGGSEGVGWYQSQQYYSCPGLGTDQLKLSESMRKVTGPLQLKPGQQKVSGYFNVDNGSGKIRGVYLQGNAAIAPIFAQWIAPLKDLGVTTLTMRNTGGTDHLSFDAVGIPGFQFIQDPLDYETRTHHSNMDTYERLQAEDLAQAALVEAIIESYIEWGLESIIQAWAPSGTGRLHLPWLNDPSWRSAIRLAIQLASFAGIALLWFIGVLRDQIGALEDHFLATVFLGGGWI
jgi:hypothetical protein